MNNARRPFIAGNWKMNTTVEEGVELAQAIAKVALPNEVDVVVCPPFTHLTVVHGEIAGSNLQLGAQDVFYELQGPFTGEISALMLKQFCDWVIVGHSERRKLGDTEEVISKKLNVANASGLGVIFCVGESQSERDLGHEWDVVGGQLASGLGSAKELTKMVIAYEPVWAIGTGLAAGPADAQKMCSAIRKWVADKFGDQIASHVRTIYGGSVNADNAGGFFAQPDIDGALPGGASLRAEEFLGIVSQITQAANL